MSVFHAEPEIGVEPVTRGPSVFRRRGR